MGSGKTTLGRELAQRLGIAFTDLDERIELEQGCTIRDLFEQHGEAGFRRLEVESLRAFRCSLAAPCVVATGGGIVEGGAGRAELRRLGTIVWLDADPAICIERLDAQRGKRPLLDPGEDWRERYTRRLPHYRRLARYRIATHPQALEASLSELLALLHQGDPSHRTE